MLEVCTGRSSSTQLSGSGNLERAAVEYHTAGMDGPPLSRIVGTCPLADLAVGDVTLKCLVDTGAQVSTIT
jgi:hypothetical protein